jgi:alpha-glucosidase (family GH31 glycosyl hydrolase)
MASTTRSRLNALAVAVAIHGVAMLFFFAPGTLSADLVIRPSGEHGVRLTLATDDLPLRASPFLVDQAWSEPAVRLKPGETKSKEKVGQMFVAVTANPLAVRVEDANGRLVQEIEFAKTGGAVAFLLGDEPVLGLGEGADQFDRRGANYRLINGQRDRLAELGTRVFSPFLLGTKGWALFVAAPNGGFDLRGERGIFSPQAGLETSGVDLFIIDAHEPGDALREFVRLTGAPAMPPKWALGYMQSHRTLSTEADLLAEAHLFRNRKLPCDAMVYLGTGFCPSGWNFGHDSFQFNTKVFAREPAAFLREMHSLNFHIALHVVPLQKDYPALHGQIPPAPNETLNQQDIGTYWQRHKQLFAAGVDGWWPDEGDWYDVPSRLARHRMYYEGPLSDRPNVRPWDLQRNGCVGIARYGGWVWSGDISSSWKTLAAQVKVGQNSSLSISPFWGSDTGGFYPAATREYTGELYVRWFQFSAFCPSFRSHGRTWHLHTPWGWNTGETGPVESRPAPDSSELHNAEVEPICRQYLNLRYQLMPYTYTITREAHDTGLPLMRSLWLHYPYDPEAVKRGDEYLWGRDLLVAPVVEPAAIRRDVYLPPGDWYDWWTGEKTAGGRTVTRQVDLKTLPLYVRAGAIVPFDPVRQYVDEPVNEPTTIRVFRGADGRFMLYDDDGLSLDYLRESGTWISFAWNDSQRKLEITSDPRTRSKLDASREFDVVLMPENRHTKVSFSGTPVEVTF